MDSVEFELIIFIHLNCGIVEQNYYFNDKHKQCHN